MKTCAANGWSVSRHVRYQPGDPAGGTLYVSRIVPDARYWRRPGDANGRTFESAEEADQFCLERGYTQRYVNPTVATFKKTHRRVLDNMRWMTVYVLSQPTTSEYKHVVRLADSWRELLLDMGLDVLNTLRFSNGVYMMARRYRPDLFEGRV